MRVKRTKSRVLGKFHINKRAEEPRASRFGRKGHRDEVYPGGGGTVTLKRVSGSESWSLCQILWSVRETADGGSLFVDFGGLW